MRINSSILLNTSYPRPRSNLVAVLSIVFLLTQALTIILFPSEANATATVALNDLSQRLDINHSIEYIHDTEKKYSWEDIDSGKYDDLFQKNNDNIYVAKEVESTNWIRVTLLPSQELNEKLAFLFVASPPSNIFRLEIRVKVGDKITSYNKTGMMEPYNARAVNNPYYAAPLPLETKEPIEVIIRANNTEGGAPTILPIFIYSEQGWYAFENRNNLLIACFLTLMGSLFFYNIFLYISLREPVYGYYILFLISASLLSAEFCGYGAKWVFPDEPMINAKLHVVNGSYIGFSYLVFIYHALDKFRFAPLFKKAYPYVLGIGIFIVLSNIFITTGTGNVLTQVYSGLAMSISLIVIILSLIRGVRSARFFVIAEFCSISGAITFLLAVHGILETNSFTLWAMHIGISAESLMLSLALADRTKQAQNSAFQNLEKYENLFSNSNEGLFQFYFKNPRVKANLALANIMGYDSVDSFQDDKDNIIDRFGSELFELLLHGNDSITGYEYQQKNPKIGKESWVSLSMRLIRDKQGNPDLVDGSVIDITEKRLKDKFDKERLAAEAANKAKTTFLAEMSHEIRTPMTAIIGMSDFLNDSLTEKPLIEYNNIIQSSGIALLDILNGILDFSKMEAGKMQLESIPFSLNIVAQDALNIFKAKANEKNLELELSIPTLLNEFYVGDPTRIRQILINFIGNAVKFTDEGCVLLSIEAFNIADDLNRETIKLSVSDTGIGVSTENQEKLFEAFSQAGANTTRMYGGTGLGLNICKQLAELMDGKVGVTSTEGEGATFWATLTLEKSDRGPASEKETHYEKVTTEKQLSVLVAEDNPAIQIVAKKYLQILGHKVKIVNNGQEAFESYCLAYNEKDPFNLVLMDYEMPIMNGIHCTKEIRAWEKDQGIEPGKIYALTAHVMAEQLNECIEAGMNGYLFKPIKRDKLIELLMKVSE